MKSPKQKRKYSRYGRRSFRFLQIRFSHGGQGRDNEKLFENAGRIIVDDVISISGKVLEPYIIAKEFEWPDIPITHQRKFAENDVSAVYLSDIHFGSRYFLDKYFELFVDWLQGKGEAKDIAGKVKYLFISGDIVDGIGIYPNQEKELIIKDVFKQYEMFRDFVEQVPDYIEILPVLEITTLSGAENQCLPLERIRWRQSK